MNRIEFTAKISQLINQMIAEGDRPVIDWVLRTAEVQKILFDKDLSNCDGYKKKSAHQSGTAMDIYLADDKGNIIFDVTAKGNEKYKKRMLYWHSVWDKNFEGDKRIVWDYPHFEG
jgi:LAS superfamily LD-carboxypeptidase LdcB